MDVSPEAYRDVFTAVLETTPGSGVPRHLLDRRVPRGLQGPFDGEWPAP